MRKLEIGICGCGPGGLAAALFLDRAGHRVRLIERFTEPKPLGSGLILQPTGLDILGRLGLAEELRERGARIDRLFGRSVPSGRVVLEVRYEALATGANGLAVHRAALFGVLFAAVRRSGIPIETGETVASHEDGCVLTAKGRRIGPFDLVVDALGSRSPLAAGASSRSPGKPLRYGALWATLPWPDAPFDPHALEQRYRRASTMVGVLPVGRPKPGAARQTCFFWSLKSAEHDALRVRGLAAWKEEVASVWPETRVLLDSISDLDQLTLARYGHHTLPRPHAGRLVMIGDAAHSTSPQLGQGANMALIDALALATALRTESGIETALATYARLRRRHIRLYQALSALFTPFYQSDSRFLPLVRDGLFSSATRFPWAAGLLASLVAGEWGRPLGGLETGMPRSAPLPDRPEGLSA